MKLAGCDFDTRGVYVVSLDFEDEEAIRYWTVALPTSPGDSPDERAFLAARRLRARLNGAVDWTGVEWVFVERPKSQSKKSLVPLMRIQGALLASIPLAIAAVWETPPWEWKIEFAGKGDASKEEVLERARELGFEHESQDVVDAFAIAWGMRAKLLRRVSEEAA